MNMDELIQRYLNQEATPEEIEQLKGWLMESDEHLQYFFRCKNLYDVYHPAFSWEKIDGEGALHKVLPLISRRRRRVLGWSAVAAMVALAVGMAFLISRHAAPERTAPPVAVAEVGTAAGVQEEGIRLTLSDGKEISLAGSADQAIRDKEGAVAYVSGGGIEYRGQDSLQEPETVYHTLSVPRGKEFFLTLDDNTRVWINAETEVRYPVKFAAHKREIYVSGEVYLEVSHCPEAPFTVVTPQSEVTVLGTSFNVKAYQDEENQITLVEGKVKVGLPEGENAVVLSPGEQARLQAHSGEIVKQRVNTELYCGWHQGKLVFRGNSLEEILQVLSRRYDMQVAWTDEALKRLSFSGEMEKQERIEDVLKLIGYTEDVKFVVDGRTILVQKP